MNRTAMRESGQVETVESTDAERLKETNKESIGRMHIMVDEMKVVQEHENAVLSGADPPLFFSESDGAGALADTEPC